MGNEDSTKAIIQNITTGFFKFAGVLELAKFQKKQFNQAYYERIFRYVNEKVSDENNQRAYTSLLLINESMKRGTNKITNGMIYNGLNTGEITKIQCELGLVEKIFTNVIEFQTLISQLEKKRTKDIYKITIVNFISDIQQRFEPILNSCAKKVESKTSIEDYEYVFFQSAYLHGLILSLDQKKADYFYNSVFKEKWSWEKQIKFTINVLSENKKIFYKQINNEQTNTSKIDGDALVDYMDFQTLLSYRPAKFEIFKKMVDYGDVCLASLALYQAIKKFTPEYFDNSITYLINAQNIDISKTVKCGDSELELLLD